MTGATGSEKGKGIDYFEMPEEKTSATRKWEDLEYGILVQIFMSLNIMDLVWGVSQVCSSWRSASRDRGLWKNLDLNASIVSTQLSAGEENNSSNKFLRLLKADFDLSTEYVTCMIFHYYIYVRHELSNLSRLCGWVDNESSKRFMLFLEAVFDLSSGQLTCLFFHYNISIRDEHLIYTAKRCPNIKRLALPPRNGVTVAGLRKAVQLWRDLEYIFVPGITNCPEVVRILGENCKNLSELKIMGFVDSKFAHAMISSLPKLKFLSLQSSLLLVDALFLILCFMENLEVLNISHCVLLEVPQTPGPIRVLRGLDAPIIEKASRLQKFFTCQRESCSLCRHTVTEYGFKRSYEFEKQLWRMDEITSLAHSLKDVCNG